MERAHAPRRPGDARDVQFDPSLAHKVLGWSAEIALLEGMRRTVDYFRERASV